MGLSRGQKDTKSSLGTVCCLKTVRQEPLPKRESCFLHRQEDSLSPFLVSYVLKMFLQRFSLSLTFYRESRAFLFFFKAPFNLD